MEMTDWGVLVGGSGLGRHEQIAEDQLLPF